MFKIEFTPESIEDLELFKKHEQVEIIDHVETRLRYQPATETRNQKRLRSNDVAEWELRIGRFRVFYSVDKEESIVIIEAVGFKIGNVLFIRDEKRAL